MPEMKISVSPRTKMESVGEVPKVRIRILSPLSFMVEYFLGAIRSKGQTNEELINNSQYNKTGTETK